MVLDRLVETRTRVLARTRPQAWDSKVFCIGFNKTGTTSVGRALADLGFRHSSFSRYVWRELYQKGEIEKVLEYTSRFESFDDLPWLREDFIPILDERFPGSKFIYLEREEESWKSSYVRWNLKARGEVVDPDFGWRSYQAHRSFVLSYFDERSAAEFLRITVSDPDSFTRLAAFVGRDGSSLSMPHINDSG